MTTQSKKRPMHHVYTVRAGTEQGGDCTQLL